VTRERLVRSRCTYCADTVNDILHSANSRD
jgi:hypothetical protein